jgi:ATP-dependent helicase/nuclease subunit A
MFREFDLPAVHAGGGSLLDTREAKDIWALLRFLAVPYDNLALAALLRSPFFALSDTILHVFAKVLPEKTTWWDALQQSTDANLQHAASVLIQLLIASRQADPLRVLQLADRLTGYTAILKHLPGNIRRKADWDGMLSLVGSMAHGPGDWFTVFRRIQRLQNNGILVPRPFIEPDNAIALMTVHGAKGLEWPVVILPDLTRKGPTHRGDTVMDPELGLALKFEDENGDRQKPALYKLIDAKQSQREDDEALRLLYVAFTRARDHLILTATDSQGEALTRLKPGLDAAGIPVLPIIQSVTSEAVAFKLPQAAHLPIDTRWIQPVG